MSKQSRAVQESLARLKAQGIITPDQRDPKQLWILVIMHPMDGLQGEVFVSHGRNFEKFNTRKGFEIIGHGWDRGALTMAARKLTKSMGEAYIPPFSNVKQALNRPSVDERSESQDVATDVPDDFLDAIKDFK